MPPSQNWAVQTGPGPGPLRFGPTRAGERCRADTPARRSTPSFSPGRRANRPYTLAAARVTVMDPTGLLAGPSTAKSGASQAPSRPAPKRGPSPASRSRAAPKPPNCTPGDPALKKSRPLPANLSVSGTAGSWCSAAGGGAAGNGATTTGGAGGGGGRGNGSGGVNSPQVSSRSQASVSSATVSA